MAYYLAPALVRLRAEINALWPTRDRSSDGWIGDTSHQARPSDHNPDYTAGGIVRAIDVDEDLTPGGSPVGKADALVAQIIRDPRVAYVIYEGRIWQNRAVFSRGGWLPYSGPNAHAHHVHVSVRRGARWDSDASSWGIARTAGAGGGSVPTGASPAPSPAPIAPPTPRDPWEDTVLIFKATSSRGLIVQGWHYLQAPDGTLRALNAQEVQAHLSLGRKPVEWAGIDLDNSVRAWGLWEYTGTAKTGPIGLTGRIIGRNARPDGTRDQGTQDRAYPRTA